jgi:hypothetical protein
VLDKAKKTNVHRAKKKEIKERENKKRDKNMMKEKGGK